MNTWDKGDTIVLHCCFVVACEGTGRRIDMDINRSRCLQKCSARCVLLYLSSQRLLKKPHRAERVGGGFGRGYVSYQIKQVAIKHWKLFPPHSRGGGGSGGKRFEGLSVKKQDYFLLFASCFSAGNSSFSRVLAAMPGFFVR